MHFLSLILPVTHQISLKSIKSMLMLTYHADLFLKVDGRSPTLTEIGTPCVISQEDTNFSLQNV